MLTAALHKRKGAGLRLPQSCSQSCEGLERHRQAKRPAVCAGTCNGVGRTVAEQHLCATAEVRTSRDTKARLVGTGNTKDIAVSTVVEANCDRIHGVADANCCMGLIIGPAITRLAAEVCANRGNAQFGAKAKADNRAAVGTNCSRLIASAQVYVSNRVLNTRPMTGSLTPV